MQVFANLNWLTRFSKKNELITQEQQYHVLINNKYQDKLGTEVILSYWHNVWHNSVANVLLWFLKLSAYDFWALEPYWHSPITNLPPCTSFEPYVVYIRGFMCWRDKSLQSWLLYTALEPCRAQICKAMCVIFWSYNYFLRQYMIDHV